ncbi:MAG: amidase domain-containing protein, partial [Anaerolineales bacterium]
MNKFTRFIWMAVIVVAILLFAGRPGTPAQASNTGVGGTPMPTNTPIVQPGGTGRVAPAQEQVKLKSVIRAYFELRYQARSASKPKGFQLSGFGNLLSNTAAAQVFLQEERSKLAVEIKNAQLNQLRYVSYKYSLQFQALTLDASGQAATVSLAEGNEVVYEISKELNPAQPIVSRAANIQHTILLCKEKGQWKIVSDRYNDDLWGVLRRNKKSTTEILSATSDMLHSLKAAPRPDANRAVIALDYNLPEDPSSHPYDRAGAAAYAHQHWSKDANQYNPDYFTFAKTDCQNFVSQALYEGGNISMFIPNPANVNGPGDGTGPGWFYLNYLPDEIDQTSGAWINVNLFFDRTTLTDPGILNMSQDHWPETWRDAYNTGPEATLLGEINPYDPLPAGLMVGDVVQFQLKDGANDGSWDHSALVTEMAGGIPYLTAHTNDRESMSINDFFPLTSKIRFLHIERSNGYPPVHTSIAAVNDDASLNPYTLLSPFPGYACNGLPANSPAWNEVYFGACPDGSLITAGFRFDKIQIPQHAFIKYAFLTFSVDGPYANPVTVNIGAAGDASDFAASNPPPASRAFLAGAATTSWDLPATDAWILGERRVTPNIAPVIEAIVQPTGWNYGNPLALLFQTSAASIGGSGIQIPYRRVVALERGEYSPAKLTVAYSFNHDVDLNRPVVYGVTRASPNPTGSASVNFTVKFSEPVTGVDVSDFTLTTTGVSGATITSLTGSGDTYTVTVNTGAGNGSIRLDVVDNGSIKDADDNLLNGGFTSGEAYTIDKTPP